MREMLMCHDYNEELIMYMAFLRERFAETKYHGRAVLKKGKCSIEEEVRTTDQQMETLVKCAKWIKENLHYNVSSMTEVLTLKLAGIDNLSVSKRKRSHLNFSLAPDSF
ncbi:hypothetical protein NQ317_016899 [Molorchus minor]|uniref:Uncharacterized protein n=1 Tax=Molorchus minor TaxID=1323400 RepID=A0ABQ9K3I9_9CUCU|nr:hypothetical protein NQ317_016899 [Molorchus minor]